MDSTGISHAYSTSNRSMKDLTYLLAQHFGVISSAHLREAGLKPSELRRLTQSGALTRLRNGWYCGDGANPLVISAVRAGGVLSGPAALKLHGVWTPPSQPIHVRLRLRKNYAPHRSVHSLVPFALSEDRAVRMDRSVDRPASALLTSMLACPRDASIVLADSLLNLEILSWSEIAMVAQRAGKRGGDALKLIADSAQSGTETYFRLWLIRNKIRFRAQARIPMVGRVDFLIGDRLVIEIDSRAHHEAPENHGNDRRRDRFLTTMGYRHVRLTYADVMYNLDEVGRDILALIRRDEHRGEPRLFVR